MTRWRGLVLSLLALAGVSAGCTVGPDYRAPSPPHGSSAPLAAFDPSLETPQQGDDAWWHLYADPELDRLITQAFAANTDLRAADANLSAARAIFEAARADQYPETGIDAAATGGRDPTLNEITEALGGKPRGGWIYDSTIDASYEIDLFGRVRRSIDSARATDEAIAAARDAVKVTVAAETARAYLEICTLGEQIAVAKQSHDVTAREASIAMAREAAGDGTILDLARAQGLAAQVGASIPDLEGERRAALFQLASLLGRTPVDAPQEAEACTSPPRLSALIPVGDGAALLRRRPDVREAERRLAAATARIGVATADLYPRITLAGFWGSASNNAGLLDTGEGLIWGIGPKITWSFPNQAVPRARIRQAKANTNAALAQFDSTVLRALNETAQALARYGSEIERRDALGQFQARERQAYGIAHDQFLAGSISDIDLLTTEQSLIAADAAVAASDATIAQDQIAVFKALGGGWQAPSPLSTGITP